MILVTVRENEPFEKALRRFRRKVEREGIRKDIKKNSFYLKPGEKRRLKQRLADRRPAADHVAGAVGEDLFAAGGGDGGQIDLGGDDAGQEQDAVLDEGLAAELGRFREVKVGAEEVDGCHGCIIRGPFVICQWSFGSRNWRRHSMIIAGW